MKTKVKKILKEINIALKYLYGERLKGIYLFGSFAQGKEVEGSDLDISIILDDFSSAEKEIDKMMDFICELSLRYNILVSIIPIREKDWQTKETPLILNIKKEGLLFK